ncbi:MAG: caspase family protein [Saprospiraceae bacterium]
MRKFIQMILDFFMKKKKTTAKNTTKKPIEPAVPKPAETTANKPSNSTKKPTTMSRNVYALMVAIDKYAAPVPPLRGCVNDRDALKDYLERQFADQQEVKLQIKTLTDSEATKQNVIQAFDLFKDAQKDDVCLFYYSGHGAPSPAPLEFLHLDPDGTS